MNSRRYWFIASVIAGGTIGATPFIGWVYLSSNSSSTPNWKSGEYRPNRIILLRHGQTHGYSHTCDCQVAGLKVCALKPDLQRPLTDEGKLQALQAGVALKKLIGSESVTFYSSPYVSCKQSFAYVAGSFENTNLCMYVEEPRLRNQCYGDWHLKEPPDRNKEFLKQSEKIGKFYYKWPNGENAAAVYDRVSSFLETMYRKWKQHDRPDNFVLITHNSVMHIFLMRWFHWDVETYSRLGKFKNGQLAVMEKQTDGSYKLITPLPCEPPIPDGVKLLAENP